MDMKMNCCDMISTTLPARRDKHQCYHTKDPQRPYTLNLAGAKIDTVKPGFFTRFLNALIDPNIISLLFLAGIAGIGFEIFHPGVVLPGALGAVALLVALFGFSVLPISWVGIMLILFGVALLVIDAHVLTHGALTVAGLIALSIGMIMLFHNAPAPYHTSTPLVLAITLSLGAFWALAISKAVKVRRSPVLVGTKRVVGLDGVVQTPGQVYVDGELWRARREDGGELVPGEHVRVEAMDGLELTVKAE
jgi:membrane-bound serine protease (ClpP class)